MAAQHKEVPQMLLALHCLKYLFSFKAERENFEMNLSVGGSIIVAALKEAGSGWFSSNNVNTILVG